MSSPIKYATTKVDASQSAMEVAEIIGKYGGTRFELRWEEGRLVGCRFAIEHPQLGAVPVQMPARAEAVESVILERKPYTRRMRRSMVEYHAEVRDQSYRIAWRHVKDFVEQVLLAVDLGVIEVHEGFMWGIEVEDPDTGWPTTMGQLLAARAHIGTSGALKLSAGGGGEVRRWKEADDAEDA